MTSIDPLHCVFDPSSARLPLVAAESDAQSYQDGGEHRRPAEPGDHPQRSVRRGVQARDRVAQP
ncbi:hypothetical protein ACFQ1S_36370, partial [Kibdelosporangium lantanae]